MTNYPETLTIEEILRDSEKAFQRFTALCKDVPTEVFFDESRGDWSVAQHLQHLIICTKTATAAYALPRFLVRLFGGRPGRVSQSFPALIANYKAVLAAGGTATGRYVPKHFKPNSNKEELVRQWRQFTTIYLQALGKNWKKEAQLDRYVVKHPLLGKITLRELCYFTIYNTDHHLNSVKARV